MKKTYFYFLLISLITISCADNVKKETSKTVVDLGKDRIEVLDFYGKHRCTSCVNIENNTKAVLAENYAQEQEKKQIVFKLIQWDKPENEALTDKFQAAGTSLILYRIKDNKEYITDITDFAFKKSDDKIAFSKGLKVRLDAELKKQ
jgi:hypothetical protein